MLHLPPHNGFPFCSTSSCSTLSPLHLSPREISSPLGMHSQSPLLGSNSHSLWCSGGPPRQQGVFMFVYWAKETTCLFTSGLQSHLSTDEKFQWVMLNFWVKESLLHLSAIKLGLVDGTERGINWNKLRISSPLLPDRAKQHSSSLHSTVATTRPGSCFSTGPTRNCVTGGAGDPWRWPERACITRCWSSCWHTGYTGALSPLIQPVRCCGTTGPTCIPLGQRLPVSLGGVHHFQDP